ncbi:MAG: hypothetical protein IPG89_22030 [Bacteroidetes bacterium]|nr:hypothetical protein [Bacteroidota bacterium]
MDVAGTKILNLNDCVFSENKKLEKIKSKLPKIDLLLTQFSYANWCGNKTDKKAREIKAAEKLGELKHRIELFKPANFIPFASYVWFCLKK